MGRRVQFAYPPCQVDPSTEKPYPRHDWEIIKDTLIKKTFNDESIYYYKVRCRRCGINDPNPPLH